MGLLVVPGTWIVACSSMLYVLPPSVTLHYWLSGYCNLCVKVALIYQLISKLNNSHATIWSMPKINQKLLLLSEQEKTLHLIRKKKIFTEVAKIQCNKTSSENWSRGIDQSKIIVFPISVIYYDYRKKQVNRDSQPISLRQPKRLLQKAI